MVPKHRLLRLLIELLGFGLIISFVISFFLDSSPTVVEVFVSTKGDDSNPGTFEAPFASIQKALEETRKRVGADSSEQVVINLRQGTYYVNSTIKFSSQDSGKSNFPTIFQSYKKEPVSINGGIRISPESFQRLTATPLSEYEELIPQDVRNNVIKVKLSDLGITDLGTLLPTGFGFPVIPFVGELYFESEPMTISRFPNNGYLQTGELESEGDKYPFSEESKGGIFKAVEVDEAKLKRWKKEGNPWAFGYWRFDWADQTTRISQIEGDMITLKSPTYYGIKNDSRYYVYNMISELDAPGEYFIDRSTEILYFYPPKPLSVGSRIEFSMLKDPILRFDHVKNFVFRFINVEVTRGTGVQILGGKNVVLDNVTIRNIGNVGVILGEGSDNHVVGFIGGSESDQSFIDPVWNRNAGTDHLISNSKIYNTGYMGVILGGGDRIKLSFGNNMVFATDIFNFGRIATTYRPGVWLDGVGNILRESKVHHGPHSAMWLWGNEHTIEYNEFHHLAYDTNDVGLLYLGRDFTTRGNTIKFNFFHNSLSTINDGAGVQAVYFDDFASGNSVFGNVFYRVNRAVLIGGGHDNSFENNIVISCNRVAIIDSRGLVEKYAKHLAKTGAVSTRYEAIPVQSSVWKHKYPSLNKIWENSPELPANNVMKNNVILGSSGTSQKSMKFSQEAIELGTIGPNFISKETEDEKNQMENSIQKEGFGPYIFYLLQELKFELTEQLPGFNFAAFTF